MPQAPFVIGINGGGTRTEFVILDRHITELARSQAGPTNIHNIGPQATQAALQQGINAVLQKAGLTLDQIGAVGGGVAGIDRPHDHETYDNILKSILPNIPFVLDNDAVPALVAGAGRRFGIVTISGTGSIAFGFNSKGERGRDGGWGYYFDRGSGYAIACDALSAMSNAHDGSGPATHIKDRILNRLGFHSFTEMISWIYAPSRGINEVAALAAEVVALENEDVVAAGILSRAADSLAREVINLARKLDFQSGEPFPLVVSGSIFTYSRLLRERFATGVQAVFSGAVLLQPERDAAVGGGMMALDLLGVEIPQPVLNGKAGAHRKPTEQRNLLTMDISQRPTSDFVGLMNIEDQRVAMLIEPQLPRIAALIDAAAERFAKGGRIILIGAGTSGRLAVLDAAECVPTFSVTHDQVIGIQAGGERAMIYSVEGAEDDEAQGGREIADRGVGPLDTVIGVAASGSTPFVIGALREATQRGVLTGSIANAAHAPISALAQHPIVVATGAEVLTGSTRLKAGTSQKLVLNMITTGVMLRVGRTFNNLMTDMQASNIKLRKRAQVIVSDATGLSIEEAASLLERCGGEMKTAITCALLKIAPDEARQRLTTAGGNLNHVAAGERA